MIKADEERRKPILESSNALEYLGSVCGPDKALKRKEACRRLSRNPADHVGLNIEG